MKQKRLGCAALAALLLCSACSMPDFDAYPVPDKKASALPAQTVTLLYSPDIDPAVGDALPLLAKKSAELSDNAVTLAPAESDRALRDFLDGKAQAALLSSADMATLSEALAFLEYPFAFLNPTLCVSFLNTAGNGFSDSAALQNTLGGTVAAVYAGDSAGLLSVGALSSDEYLTGCRIAVSDTLPGTGVFSLMQAESVAEVDAGEIADDIAAGEFTQGEWFYSAPIFQAAGITHFYATDHRAVCWWLVLKTQGDAALSQQTIDILRNAAAYLVTPIEDAVRQRRTDCLAALSAMGVQVADNDELEYYFYSASDVYAEHYAEYGLSEKLYNAVSDINF